MIHDKSRLLSSVVKKTVTVYKRYVTGYAALAPGFPHVHVMRYEDLVMHPDAALREIADFVRNSSNSRGTRPSGVCSGRACSLEARSSSPVDNESATIIGFVLEDL